MTIKYILIHNDNRYDCEGIARVLNTFDTKAEADNEMVNAVKTHLETNHKEKIIKQRDDYTIVCDGEYLFFWQILEITI